MRSDPPPSQTKPGQTMEDLVRAAATEAQQRHDAVVLAEAQGRRQAGRKRTLLLLGVLVPILGLLIALNLSGDWLVFGARRLSPAERHQRALADVSFVVEAIEAYRAQRGTLPPTLAALDLRGLERWTYELSAGDRYRLSYNPYGNRIDYDSSRHGAGFFHDVRRAGGKGAE